MTPVILPQRPSYRHHSACNVRQSDNPSHVLPSSTMVLVAINPNCSASFTANAIYPHRTSPTNLVLCCTTNRQDERLIRAFGNQHGSQTCSMEGVSNLQRSSSTELNKQATVEMQIELCQQSSFVEMKCKTTQISSRTSPPTRTLGHSRLRLRLLLASVPPAPYALQCLPVPSGAFLRSETAPNTRSGLCIDLLQELPAFLASGLRTFLIPKGWIFTRTPPARAGMHPPAPASPCQIQKHRSQRNSRKG